ncbi:methyl-accepting chemotaxis protein [Brevibacillus fulvus]|uniref:Methyl-accepting chemotaxis protein n=1 Tax=Brevibacillus fulvus TaxID=1125967 RepID=A0A938Y0X0_9BACL|nr:HAMP domain-containing methyl-accepting chemotaxis protein [Brevibacillus fulvus]MBM7589105.1 methyl-accepting chemotaxis protein [Brevibacillus fulvus]
MKLTIGKKLIIGFLTVAIVSAIVSAVSLTSLKTVNSSYSDLVDRRAAMLVNAKEIQLNATQLNSYLRDYLLTQNSEAIKQMEGISNRLAQLVQSNLGMVYNQQDKDLLGKIDRLRNAFNSSKNQLESQNIEQAMSLATTSLLPLSQEIINIADQLSTRQQDLMSQGSQANTALVDRINMLVLVLSAVAFVAAIGIGYFVSRMLSKPVISIAAAAEAIAAGNLTIGQLQVKNKDEIGDLARSFERMKTNLLHLIQQVGMSADQVAASAEQLTASASQTSLATEQIASTIQEVASGAEQQASSVEQGEQLVSQIVEGIRRMAANAERVSATSVETSLVASQGQQAVQTANDQMDSINNTVNHLSVTIKELGDRSEEIGHIVQVITEISAQINLLALNAAIEAARAGEHGKGFAVVAEEVRKLAEQSAQSAKQINERIVSIQAQTSKAVDSMDHVKSEVNTGMDIVTEAASAFKEIRRSVEDVVVQIQEVTAEAQQMVTSMEEVTRSIHSIGEVAKTTAANTQNVSASAEEQLAAMEEISSSASALSTMSEELQHQIAQFKV